jgi:tetratricopeptide (TPR) repeat protein
MLQGNLDPVSPEALAPVLFAERDAETGARMALSDMRRLSDLLAEYHETEGMHDAVRTSFEVASGTLAFALFEQLAPAEDTAHSSALPKKRVLLGTLLAAAAILSLVLWTHGAHDKNTVATGSDEISLEVTAARSPLMPKDVDADTLSAEELNRIGHKSFFPFFEVEQQKEAVAHFLYVNERHPEFAGAYASAAHSFASMTLVMRGSGRSLKLLDEAAMMRDAALERAPNDPWTLSAVAWVAFAQRDFETAIDFSEQSYEMAPRDGRILDFYSLLALLTGRYEQARRASNPMLFAGEDDPRTNHLIFYGYASLHLGEYAKAVDAFQTGLAGGEEQNAIRAMYLAAAYQAQGQSEKARVVFDELRDKWPMFRPEIANQLLLSDPRKGDLVLTYLKELGWKFDN